MPIYEYRCRKCGNVFEEWVKTFDSPELEPCPKCGGWFASCYGGKSGSAGDAAPAGDKAPAKADAAPAKAEAAASGSGGGSEAATA